MFASVGHDLPFSKHALVQLLLGRSARGHTHWIILRTFVNYGAGILCTIIPQKCMRRSLLGWRIFAQHDTRIVPTKPKAVAQRHVNCSVERLMGRVIQITFWIRRI